MSSKLKQDHPFVQAARQLELLEVEEDGITDKVINTRKELKNKFPEYYEEYIQSKNLKQQNKIHQEKIDIIKRGGPTSDWLEKRFEDERKNKTT